MPENTKLLAVLIDADNTSPKYTKAIFDEIAALGEASVRRCYGDFSSQQMAGWSKITAEYGLVPLHSPANTVGKKSTARVSAAINSTWPLRTPSIASSSERKRVTS